MAVTMAGLLVERKGVMKAEPLAALSVEMRVAQTAALLVVVRADLMVDWRVARRVAWWAEL